LSVSGTKPLFVCVHRIFGHQFIAPGGEKTPPTNVNRRTSRTWRMIVLSAGIRSLLWKSQRRGPESAGRGTCHPGRDHRGMVGGIISERWAELSRNGRAASFRNHGRLAGIRTLDAREPSIQS
jgi:hypothetical protein